MFGIATSLTLLAMTWCECFLLRHCEEGRSPDVAISYIISIAIYVYEVNDLD